MRILITGGVGFIGTNLVKKLLSKKSIKKIIIVDNFYSTSKLYLREFTSYSLQSHKNYRTSKKRVEIVKANICDKKFAEKITRGMDYVVHLAAESGVDISISNPSRAFKVNVNGTFNYLESSRLNNVKGFIFASSGSVFGDLPPPHTENLYRKPISPYGSSKLTIETFCESYSNVFNIDTTVLRFSNVYGSYSEHKNSVVHKYIRNILTGKQIIINGDGEHTRDYIYVEDIISAIIKCLKKINGSNSYHVGTGKETSLTKLIKVLKKIFIRYDIEDIKTKNVKRRIGDVRKNFTSFKKIKKDLKWKPSKSLENGLEATIKWYISRIK